MSFTAIGQQTQATTSNDAATGQQGQPGNNVTVTDTVKPTKGDDAKAGQNKPKPARPSQPQPRTPCEHFGYWLKSLNSADRIAFAAVCVTTIYLFFTIMIWGQMVRANKHAERTYEENARETEESLKLTRDGQTDTRRAVAAAEKQLAAIISVARARIAVLAIDHLDISVDLDIPGKTIKVTIINRGYTPAIDVRWGGRSAIAPKGERIRWSDFSEEDDLTASTSVFIIGAGLESVVPIKLLDLTEEEKATIHNGEAELHLQGVVAYWDVFESKAHSMEFTAIYSAPDEHWTVGYQIEQ
jgi:hypothetical protein